MNVTENQKEMLVNFMRLHPDFGRGRLRYNRDNKKRLEELWQELTLHINSAGKGPKKEAKEWAKTWRDWKSNLLKKVAAYKSHAGQTGGGPPMTLNLSSVEESLLAFITPEASGLSGIPEGGALEDTRPSTSFLKSRSFIVIPEENTCSEQTLGIARFDIHRPGSSSLNTYEDDTYDAENHAINISPNVHRSAGNISSNVLRSTENISSNVLRTTENMQEQDLVRTETQTPSTQNKRKLLNDSDTGSKKTKKQRFAHLFEQHTSEYSDIQQRILQVKEEKLALAKEQFEFTKRAHEERTKIISLLIRKVVELTESVQNLSPQYLDE